MVKVRPRAAATSNPMTHIDIDIHSLTWRSVEAWAEDEISQTHERLEQTGLTQQATEYERGRIAALRDLLRLKEPPHLPEPAVTYDGQY